ncbi:MAG: helix-turn-helix transcriptional regulator [Desulfosalsimonas sp.]
MKSILHTQKIQDELSQRGKSQAWLAKQMGVSRQRLYHILKHRPITQADCIAKVLGYEPKDLITYE